MALNLKDSSSELYKAFLAEDFDANAYANSLLARADGSGGDNNNSNATNTLAISSDVGPAISRLNGVIDELHRQMRNKITTHHSPLLGQAANLSTLESALEKVTSGLTQVDSGVERLKAKIQRPYTNLSELLDRHDSLLETSELARRVQRAVVLSKRLRGQMDELRQQISNDPAAASLKEQQQHQSGRTVLVDAALTCADIDGLLEGGALAGIAALKDHLAQVEEDRLYILDQIQALLNQGIQQSDQEIVGSALRLQPTIISDFIADMLANLQHRIKLTFDMNSLSREMNKDSNQSSATSAFGYKSRARTEPTNATAPSWQNALWARIQDTCDLMAETCIKIYTLEKALQVQRQPVQQALTSKESIGKDDRGAETRPSFLFWTTVAKTFEHCSQDACRHSTFLQQTLGVNNYPRLLRNLQEFFGKIGIHTDTVYSRAHQSPETVLLLRAVAPFESLYLSRSNSRLNEAVATALQGGTRTPPGATEGLTASRTLVNELDAARFDPLLLRSVAKNVSSVVSSYGQRIDNLVAVDHSATSLVGLQATPSQALNAELINALYHFWSPLSRLLTATPDYPEDTGVPDLLLPAVSKLRQQLYEVASPLLSAIRRDFGAILSRMHRVNFATPSDSEAGSSSPYLKDLGDKLAFVRGELLRPLKLGEMSKEWAVDLGRFLVREFLLHASIIRPLGEQGKLRLVSDLTSLEFSVSQLLSDYRISMGVLGEDFTSLRALRPLLFEETKDLAQQKNRASFPLLLLCHHVIVRAPTPLQLPHQLHGWQEAEYVRWINEHDKSEQLQLVQGSLDNWRAGSEQEDAVKPFAEVLEQLLSSQQQQQSSTNTSS